MHTIKVREFFEAAHRIHDNPSLTTTQCSRLHGHTYLAEITIETRYLENGFVIDFANVKNIVKQLDHKTILGTNDPLCNKIDSQDLVILQTYPTAESIAEWISHEIKGKLGLHSEIKLCEGYHGEERTNWVFYKNTN